MLETITQFIISILDQTILWGYVFVFAAAMFETLIGVGMFIPGSVVVLVAGALVTQGYFDLKILFIGTVISAVAGDNFNYFLGRKYGARLVVRGFWFVGAHHIDAGKRFFDKHGAKSVFFGRFLPSVKEIVPFLAGIVKMDYWKFTFWNLLGSLGWSAAWLGFGYMFAQSLHIAYKMLTHAEKVIVSVVILAVGIYIIKLIIVHRHKLMPSQEERMPVFGYQKPKWARVVTDKYGYLLRKEGKNKTKKLFDDL